MLFHIESIGLPTYIDSGMVGSKNYVVMPNYGQSLQRLIFKRWELIASKTVFQIGIQLVRYPHFFHVGKGKCFKVASFYRGITYGLKARQYIDLIG